MQHEAEQLRTRLIAEIIPAIDGNTSQENLLTLFAPLRNNPAVKSDSSLLQSYAVLQFLVRQIEKGNGDLITLELIRAAYTDMLNILTPGTKLIM